MESLIYKIILVCLLSAALILSIKNVIPSYAPLISLASGVFCFFVLAPYIKKLVSLIDAIGEKIVGVDNYIAVSIKIVGISLVCEFASQMCCDMGEGYLSTKIDFAGKIIIVCMCAPEFLNLISTVVDMIAAI